VENVFYVLCKIIYDILDLLKKVIGKGGFSTVWLCEDVSDGKEYAIKEIIEKELDISKRIGSQHDCPGIVHIYDSFRKDEKLYIVMEYCKKGSLLDFIKNEGSFLNENVSHVH
jgi:serine/threonine protein kinase